MQLEQHRWAKEGAELKGRLTAHEAQLDLMQVDCCSSIQSIVSMRMLRCIANYLITAEVHLILLFQWTAQSFRCTKMLRIKIVSVMQLHHMQGSLTEQC